MQYRNDFPAFCTNAHLFGDKVFDPGHGGQRGADFEPRLIGVAIHRNRVSTPARASIMVLSSSLATIDFCQCMSGMGLRTCEGNRGTEVMIANVDENVLQQLRRIAWQVGVPVEEMTRRLLLKGWKTRQHGIPVRGPATRCFPSRPINLTAIFFTGTGR